MQENEVQVDAVQWWSCTLINISLFWLGGTTAEHGTSILWDDVWTFQPVFMKGLLTTWTQYINKILEKQEEEQEVIHWTL